MALASRHAQSERAVTTEPAAVALDATAAEDLVDVSWSSNVLDEAVDRVTALDPALAATLEREVSALRGGRSFGLVFEKHLPEAVRLPGHPIRPGVKVKLRTHRRGEQGPSWRVRKLVGRGENRVALLDDGSTHPIGECVAVRDFGEPVYPGLEHVERITNPGSGGGDPGPTHTVINGENHHVLQALLYTHRESIDLIYIDPPYNTGNKSWIYNDRYVAKKDDFKHSKWLSFMERRLVLSRELLSNSGVIIVAIGDGEHHRLRMLMDQVFGADNFISDVVWNGSRKNDATFISNAADYMLVYARDLTELAKRGKWLEPKLWADEVLSVGSDLWEASGHDADKATKQLKAWFAKQPRGKFTASQKHYSLIDDQGRVFSEADPGFPNGQGPRYEVLHPVTGQPCRVPENGWRFAEDVFMQMIADGDVYFRPDHTALPRPKTFLFEQLNEKAESVFYASRKGAASYLTKLFGDKRFPYPKDREILMRWIRLTAPRDGIVLDFFGGSGTTSEAVMRLNAEDGGSRQSILVTNNEVGAKDAAALSRVGHQQGSPEWEAMGVFEHVTRPRISTVVTGIRPDGSVFGDGLAADVEFFRLSYLDESRVERAKEFEAIAPLLWLRAGGTGQRIAAEPKKGWELVESYGVLVDVDTTDTFVEAVAQAVLQADATTVEPQGEVSTMNRQARSLGPPRHVFVVTDSSSEFAAVCAKLPESVRAHQLYASYLRNFEINTGASS